MVCCSKVQWSWIASKYCRTCNPCHGPQDPRVVHTLVEPFSDRRAVTRINLSELKESSSFYSTCVSTRSAHDGRDKWLRAGDLLVGECGEES
jgi:hypothetical protein